MADDDYQRSPFLVPPLPEEVIRNARTTDKRTGGGTENVVEAPERAAVRGDIDTLEADHQKAMDTKLAHDEATAHINEQSAQAAVNLADQQQQERDKAYRATQPGIDDWRTRLRESMDRFDKQPAPKLFADGSTTENVLKGIGLALAGLGDAVTTRALITAGHAPTGKNSVADIIEADLARQREAARTLSDRIVTARTGLNDANAARAQLLAEVDQRGAIAFKRADLVAKARLAGEGMDAAKIEANLDQLGWRQKSLELKEQSVAPLVNHVTTNHQSATGTETSDTQNINKKTPGSQIPTHVTDLLTGKDLPVDPTGTDTRQHNTAVGKLGPINTFVDTANKLIAAADATGPARNELLAKVFGGGGEGGKQEQADRSAAITRLRSAYAAAKGESVGEGNSKHLAEAIPDPPSSLAPDGAWQAWKTKIKAVNEEMHQLRKENLAAAGVPRAALEAPEASAKPKPAAPSSTPAAAPSPPKAVTPRDRVIELLRTSPNYGKRGLLMKTYGITPAELAQ